MKVAQPGGSRAGVLQPRLRKALSGVWEKPCREGPRLPDAAGPARLLAAGPDGGLPRGSRVCSALPGRKWTDGPGAGSSEGLSQNEVKVGNSCSSENLGIDNHAHALRVFYKESI